MNCVVDFEGIVDIPNSAYEGLKIWRESEGGAFDEPLTDILLFIEDTLTNGIKSEQPLLYCFEYDFINNIYEIKGNESSCIGALSNCPFFKVRTRNEMCVLTSVEEKDNKETEVIESTFFLGEGFEKKGLMDEAQKYYKKTFEYYPDNEFLKGKLNIKKRKFLEFWK